MGAGARGHPETAEGHRQGPSERRKNYEPATAADLAEDARAGLAREVGRGERLAQVRAQLAQRLTEQHVAGLAGVTLWRGRLVLGEVFRRADAEGVRVRVGALKGSDSNRFYLRHGFQPDGQGEFDN